MQYRGRFVRKIPVIAVLVTALIVACTDQSGTAEPVTKEDYPANTVVIRFNIDPASLEAVQNSADLTEALHQGIELEAASPLDFEVVIHLNGNVFQNRDQQPHPVASGISVDIDKGKPVNGLIKDLRFYTYGDFSEREAWAYFQEELQSAILYSMNASGAFETAGDGTIPLTVAKVVDGSEIIEPDGKSMVLELTAEVSYRDGSKFGSQQPPEGYTQELKTVQILLSSAQGAAHEAVTDAATESPDPDIPAASSGGITGIYGIENGAMSIQEKDGQFVMSNPNMHEPEDWPMTEIGENHFSVVYNGTPVELKFSVDDDGNAFAMTIVQGGHEMKMPRKE